MIVYGHYDVQDVGPADEWQSDPFEPTVRDGRLYARGSSDDKGNFLPVLHAACELHAAGELPVNVRVLIEGEEEVGSPQILEWIARDERGGDAAIVFDAAMPAEGMPAITTTCRGNILATLTVRVAERDLHSGLFGGVAPNAVHALMQMLGAVVPALGEELRAEFREGVAPVAESERASWADVPPGPEFQEKTGAQPDIEVNGIISGATDEPRTILPAFAKANLSLRTAPGQNSAELGKVLERLLREAAPDGAEVEFSALIAEPAQFDPDSPQEKPGQPARFSFCLNCLWSERLGSSQPKDCNQISGSRNTFASSSDAVSPSGKEPRLYSAIRFFHFKKSVMLCGSIRSSTRRRLASSRFIS